MKAINQALMAAGVLLNVASPVVAEPVWVQVRESMVRAKPLFYSQSISTVRYGDQLEKIAQDAGWAKISTKKGEGYIPVTTISADRIVLSAKDITKVKADSAEVVLAGKGFSKEVEQEYKKMGSTARFDLVDQVERVARVSHQDVKQFVKSGDLKG